MQNALTISLNTSIAICIVLNICSCTQLPLEKKTEIDLIHEFIDKYLPKEYYPGDSTTFSISDSLVINSLQTTLYRIDPGLADASEYVLLLDRQTEKIYPIIRQHWSIYNQPLSKELANKILENSDSKYNIEPVNYSFLHFEIFLNQCKALESRTLDFASVDSIFRFYLDDHMYRIQTISQLDSIASLSLTEIENLEIKQQYKKRINLLKKKIIEPGVFIYQGRYDNPFEYFEINGTKDLHNYLTEGIFKNMYNLKVLWLWPK